MMTIRILENTVASLRNVRKGEVLSVNDKDARYLIAIKRAEPVLPVAAPANDQDTEVEALPEAVQAQPEETKKKRNPRGES